MVHLDFFQPLADLLVILHSSRFRGAEQVGGGTWAAAAVVITANEMAVRTFNGGFMIGLLPADFEPQATGLVDEEFAIFGPRAFVCHVALERNARRKNSPQHRLCLVNDSLMPPNRYSPSRKPPIDTHTFHGNLVTVRDAHRAAGAAAYCTSHKFLEDTCAGMPKFSATLAVAASIGFGPQAKISTGLVRRHSDWLANAQPEPSRTRCNIHHTLAGTRAGWECLVLQAQQWSS